MKQHIVSLPHHPKRVIIISLVIAIAIGAYGYQRINQKPTNFYNQSVSEIVAKNNVISQKQNITLGFLTGGRIKSVLVKTGDSVKSGQVLATLDAGNVLGALTQAKASYATAQANYQKVINGATVADITVSNSSVEIAKATLAHTKETLILALGNSLTSATNAINNNTNSVFDNPNTLSPEIKISDVTFSNQQLENAIISERVLLNEMMIDWKSELTEVPATSDFDNLANDSLKNLQDTAKYIDDLNSLFTLYASVQTANSKLIITNITSARSSITLQIAALTGAYQAVSSAEKNVEQNQAVFKQKTSAARPEDVEIAKSQVNQAYGAVQIAEAAYENTIITAPEDGTVLSIAIAPGQIAIPNSPAIEFISNIKY